MKKPADGTSHRPVSFLFIIYKAIGDCTNKFKLSNIDIESGLAYKKASPV